VIRKAVDIFTASKHGLVPFYKFYSTEGYCIVPGKSQSAGNILKCYWTAAELHIAE
jgi:hypothetical protein